MKEEIFEMAFWNRKKKKDEQPLMPPPCRHRWKDFPWYINAEYFSGIDRFEFRVYEPYVCIYCKERQDKLIFEFISSISKKEADKYIENFEEKYDEHLEDRVIIEDMITDMQLVDREYLNIYESLKTLNPDKTPKLTI